MIMNAVNMIETDHGAWLFFRGKRYFALRASLLWPLEDDLEDNELHIAEVDDPVMEPWLTGIHPNA
jgi:hypothetical protein